MSITSLRVFNVTRYGMSPGASHTVNNAGFTAVYNAAAAAGGGIIFFPSGVYTVSSCPNIATAGITLRGEGATIKWNAPTSGNARVGIAASNVTVENLKFDGFYDDEEVSGSDSGLIIISGSTELTNVNIFNCSFANCMYKGIYIAGPSEGIKINSCSFDNIFNCIFQTSSDDGTPQKTIIINNSFKSGWSTANFSGAVKLKTQHSTWSGGHVITGNVIDSAGEMGIELWSQMCDSVISNNVIHGCTFGISLDNNKNCAVTGNVIWNCSYLCVEAASSCSDITITGNSLSGYSVSSGTTRAGDFGIQSSNNCTQLTITGNSFKGFDEKAVHILNASDSFICGNQFNNSGCCVYMQNCNETTIISNYLESGSSVAYHLFMDSGDGNTSGYTICDNVFVGAVTQDNLIFYDSGNNRTVSRVVIKGNTMLNATYGNVSLNYGTITESNRVQWIVDNNVYHRGSSRAEFIPYNTSDVNTPYLTSMHKAGMTVAKKFTFTPATAAAERWYKLFDHVQGVQIYIEMFIETHYDGIGHAAKYAIMISPYGQGAAITIYPMAYYQGPQILEVIANNDDGGTGMEIWIRLKANTSPNPITVWGSDFAESWISTPTAVTSEPTWNSNHKKVKWLTYATALSVDAIEVESGINIDTSSGQNLYWPPEGRLYIRGQGPYASNIVNIKTTAWAESFKIDNNGYVYMPIGMSVGGGLKFDKIVGNYVGIDFPSIAANDETTVTATVTGAHQNNGPSVQVTFWEALPAGVILAQAWVSAANTVSIKLRNLTGSAIDPATIGTRIIVMNFDETGS